MSYVLLQCVKEKSKLRVKMISSSPFIKGINCQFSRTERVDGMYYVVKSEGVKLKGNFYSAMQKDIIICKTFNLDEVKKYIDNLNTTEKIKIKAIFGDDDGDNECIICLADVKDSVFAPCGHYITCSSCSIQCKNCPMCRGKITTILKRNEIAD
ncbi:MAG: hypothetical protein Terrestrivirus1_89 [Terrestrivirus sp.]|uniref:RING-type domain-containing protein n=1 Tax=Terrestrivirus sp. TaxID=2487775 RepID=A0A3G4ZK51_9VIRU|nr:MAG: hypothetical protein Terrestrivirus1_89 [Terrestrivirus sp.]